MGPAKGPTPINLGLLEALSAVKRKTVCGVGGHQLLPPYLWVEISAGQGGQGGLVGLEERKPTRGKLCDAARKALMGSKNPEKTQTGKGW